MIIFLCIAGVICLFLPVFFKASTSGSAALVALIFTVWGLSLGAACFIFNLAASLWIAN